MSEVKCADMARAALLFICKELATKHHLKCEMRDNMFGFGVAITDGHGKLIVDIAYGPYTYGYPERFEIMGLLHPDEAKDDDVRSVSLTGIINRIESYMAGDSDLIIMGDLGKKKE